MADAFLIRSGGGGNLDSELTKQEELITDITEALVGKVYGANATPETLLKGYSAYVHQNLVEGTLELPEPGVDLLGILGYTQMAIDEFTFTTNTDYSAKLTHSLGTYPKLAMVLRDATVCKPYAVVIATALSLDYSTPDVQLYETKDSTSNKRDVTNGVGTTADLSSDYVRMGLYTTRGLYVAGVKYTLITMA